MNNEVERYVGELRDLRRVHHTILKNKETLAQWVTWLDAEIRQGVLSDWEKEKKRELKRILEELLTDQIRVSGVPYTVMKESIE